MKDDGAVGRALNDEFAGELLVPGELRYESARRVWNGRTGPGELATRLTASALPLKVGCKCLT